MEQGVLLLFLALALATVHAEVTSLAPCPCSAKPDSCGDTPTMDSALQQGLAGGDYLLQAGEHCVRNYSLIQDLVNVSLEGPAKINCTAGNGLAFCNMTNLHLAHLTIDGCGLGLDHLNSFLSAVRLSIHYFFTLTNGSEQYVAMALGNCTDFCMENSSISNTEGLGLLGINIMGQSTLDNVTFERNVPKGCFSTNSYNFTTEKVGGGAIFSYNDLKYANLTDDCNFSIVDSKFKGNSYCGYGPYRAIYFQQDQLVRSDAELFIGAGGGLSFMLTQLDYQVDISVRHSTFLNNTALFGGGANVEFFTGAYDSRIFFDNCVFQFNGVEDSSATYAVVGSALLMIKDFAQPVFRELKPHRNYKPSQIMVNNSLFMNNTATTATVDFHSLYGFILNQRVQNDVVFSNCTFEHNRAVTAPGIFMEEWKGNTLQLGTNIVLDNVTFSHNSVYGLTNISFPETSQGIGVVVAKAINLTISGDSLFSHNEVTAMAATTTTIYIMGNVTFFNNSGSYGGGLSLSQSSSVIVGVNTTLGFYNNNGVLLGGAIFVSSPIGGVGYDCFLHFGPLSLDCTSFFANNCPDITKFGAEIIFDGNVSPLGNMIYGSTLNTCPWTKLFRELYAPGQDSVGILNLLYNSSDTFTSPLKFDGPPQGTVAVTTPTTRILVDQPDGAGGNSNIHMSPGISLLLNVTSLDALQQAIPAVITSRSLTDGTTSVLGDNNFQFTNYNTSEFTDFEIFGSPNQTVEVALLAVSSYAQIKLTINLTACPDGYYLENLACVCSQNLKNNSFSCTKEGELLVPYGSWVGNDADVLMFGSCPLDYCRPEISIVNVADSSIISDSSIYDVQCNSNYSRGGVACGSCIEGYSTVLGSNRCMKCSNTSLIFLLAFAAYGIILIVGMIFLQFTISEGFLNGVLFFSNILTVFAPYFLSNEIRQPFLVFFWLSLKVGFEYCLFDGMTALSSTALNFVFPFYLYFLLLVIVLLSRWSSRFSRLLSSRTCSPIKVFATIMVMTYTSLLETCISILAFTPLREVGTTDKIKASYRWTYDPSVHYFQHYHAPLAVFAILLLLILIPAPFLWMFPKKISSIARFNKYKPLYDAVWAPLKTRFRFWVSLRLVLRIFPFIVINFISIPTNLLLLCLFLLILLFVHGVVQPFHGSTQNAIDSLFQVELLGLTLLTLYFTRFDLALNRQLEDVETVKRGNHKIAETDTIQLILVIFTVVSAYLSLVVVFLLHLMTRFPRLKRLFIRGWNYVTCKRFHLKQHYKRLSTTNPQSPSSYGSAETVGGDDSTRTPVVTTYSVLREPLLASGEAEMYAP